MSIGLPRLTRSGATVAGKYDARSSRRRLRIAAVAGALALGCGGVYVGAGELLGGDGSGDATGAGQGYELPAVFGVPAGTKDLSESTAPIGEQAFVPKYASTDKDENKSRCREARRSVSSMLEVAEDPEQLNATQWQVLDEQQRVVAYTCTAKEVVEFDRDIVSPFFDLS